MTYVRADAAASARALWWALFKSTPFGGALEHTTGVQRTWCAVVWRGRADPARLGVLCAAVNSVS